MHTSETVNVTLTYNCIWQAEFFLFYFLIFLRLPFFMQCVNNSYSGIHCPLTSMRHNKAFNNLDYPLSLMAVIYIVMRNKHWY